MTVDRLGQVQEAVAFHGDILVTVAQRLQEYATRLGDDEPIVEAEAAVKAPIEAEAATLLAFRRNLLDLLELTLPDDFRDRLRGAFTAVGIADAEDRRALAEMVAERPILSLADLTIAEAERLFVEIRKQEEPF